MKKQEETRVLVDKRKLRDAIDEKGYSKEALSLELGYSKSYLSVFLSDEKYNEVEESIKSYLEEIDTININITHEIFRNIKFNIMRSSRKLEIMCIFEKYIFLLRLFCKC